MYLALWQEDTTDFKGEQGWRSDESARLPPMWPGFDSSREPYGLSLLLVLILALRVFLPVLRFSSLAINQHFPIPIRHPR